MDDLLIIGYYNEEIEKINARLKMEFKMTDLGTLSHFLGIEFAKINSGILMHQKRYINEVLNRFGMLDCNPAATPLEVGNTLSKCRLDDEATDSTLYRQMVGTLR
ncbi:PREDICTED: uncharacterized protein LOC109352910 [Lupinus angustifolius]|uniref:uncharacterized protein LOC109352910 n=1 Tax=Lupinus angustifolius TaxID=3871 RepID=UPI00092F5968|nr:PREDICTED: uncharacterized protein LOC109352910 [Lupinus angustifolius]